VLKLDLFSLLFPPQVQRETPDIMDPLVVQGSQDPRETVASPVSQDPQVASDPRAPQDQPFRGPREAPASRDHQDEEVRGGDTKIHLRDTLLPGLHTCLV